MRKIARDTVMMRCSQRGIRMNEIFSSALTGPDHENVTERHDHSGTAGPVWIFALLSYFRFISFLDHFEDFLARRGDSEMDELSSA